MGFELLADSSPAGLLPQDAGSIAERLQSAEAQIAILVVCALIALRIVMSIFGKQPAGSDQGSIETVPLTDQGPLFVGSRARLTLLNEQNELVLDGIVEGLDRHCLSVSVTASASHRVRTGSSVRALFPIANVAYRFTAIVQDQRHGPAGTTLCFRRPEWVERVQQRGHHRVKVDRAASVSRVDSSSPSGAVFSGTVQNLSSAGMLVCLPFRPPTGSILRVRIVQEGLEDSSYEVRVVRTGPAGKPHGGTWSAGCEFLWMDEASQARLTRACMEIERGLKAAAR